MFPNSMPPIAGKIAALLVASILLHGFVFHNSLWKSNLVRLPHSRIPPVNVKVLVESLCIDSKHFVHKQLSQAYRSLGPTVINLQLVPFGNARFVPAEEDGGDEEILQCQHGIAECDANAFEQCVAMNLYPNAQHYFPFFQCLYKSLPMGHRDELFDRHLFEVCARKSGLDWRRIAACRDDVDQVVLLQRKAFSLTPKYHVGIPWVEIDGKHIAVDEDENAFIHAVCRAYIANGGHNPVCPTSLSD